ncbi:MAG: hypothetical protein RIC55_06890 [Pirellulaceae bacterium]
MTTFAKSLLTPVAIALLTVTLLAGAVLGEDGLAAKYPGDVGIARDPAVVFVENFDAGPLEEILKRWESVQHREILSLSSESLTDGGKSLLMTHVGGQGDGAHLYRRLAPGHDKLYVRFYVKFARDCAPIHHFFHIGGYQPATAWPQGGAGRRPRGDERFTIGIEPHGQSWAWDYYAYWMEMRGSPPRGQTWGNSFLGESKVKVARDTWICVELMTQVNAVGESDGELALWIDGRPISHLGRGFPRGKWIYDKFLPGQGGEGVRWSDERRSPRQIDFPRDGLPFEGFRWRSDERLKLNFLWLLLYITKSPPDHESRIWFDNIVVAKEYIGPLRSR